MDYNAYSISYFNRKIFLGLKNNKKTSLLFEYEFQKENDEIKFECIGKGCDLCLKIPFIYPITEKTIVTSNKNNFKGINYLTEIYINWKKQNSNEYKYFFNQIIISLI